MNFKQKLAYFGLGGLFVAIGYMLASGGRGVRAQSEPLVFDKIICRELEVVDEKGKRVCRLYSLREGGIIRVLGKDGTSEARLSIGEYGGYISASGKDGVRAVFLEINRDRVRIEAQGKVRGNFASLHAHEEWGGAVGVGRQKYEGGNVQKRFLTPDGIEY